MQKYVTFIRMKYMRNFSDEFEFKNSYKPDSFVMFND